MVVARAPASKKPHGQAIGHERGFDSIIDQEKRNAGSVLDPCVEDGVRGRHVVGGFERCWLSCEEVRL